MHLTIPYQIRRKFLISVYVCLWLDILTRFPVPGAGVGGVGVLGRNGKVAKGISLGDCICMGWFANNILKMHYPSPRAIPSVLRYTFNNIPQFSAVQEIDFVRCAPVA